VSDYHESNNDKKTTTGAAYHACRLMIVIRSFQLSLRINGSFTASFLMMMIMSFEDTDMTQVK
jgi:hypothetical protein